MHPFDQRPASANSGRPPAAERLDRELVYTLQDKILESPDVEEFLAGFASVAATQLTTSSTKVRCGVTVIRPKREPILACSDEDARKLDILQYGFGDGPCLWALKHNTVALVPDTRTERRWPEFTTAAADLGTGSILAIALDLAGEADAVMNLYATNRHGFSSHRIILAQSFAERTAASLRLALHISHLRHTKDDLTAAMASRTIIDIAIGIVIAQNRCSKDAAFRVLTDASNHRNIKLRDLASQLVASVSGESEVTTTFKE